MDSLTVPIINAGDISEDCGLNGSLLNPWFEYVFILLMGQSKWSILNDNDCLKSPVRAMSRKIVLGINVMDIYYYLIY